MAYLLCFPPLLFPVLLLLLPLRVACFPGHPAVRISLKVGYVEKRVGACKAKKVAALAEQPCTLG